MDHEDRTAPPSERRRRQAREQGLGPLSTDLCLGVRMLGIAAGLHWFGSTLVRQLGELMCTALQSPVIETMTIDAWTSQFASSVLVLAASVAGLLGTITGAGLLARLIQVGFRINAGEVIPDIQRISPSLGIHRMLRWENVTVACVAFLKFTLIATVGGWFVCSRLDQLQGLAEYETSALCITVGQILLSLLGTLAIVQSALGCLDYAWQYWKFEQSLKMTPQELRDER